MLLLFRLLLHLPVPLGLRIALWRVVRGVCGLPRFTVGSRFTMFVDFENLLDRMVVDGVNLNPFFTSAVRQYADAPGDVILDIGANHGFMSLYAKAVCPHALVIAIEPSHREVHRLLRNLDLSGMSIPVVVAAAGSEMIGLRLSPAGNMGMSTTHAAGEGGAATPVSGLDLGRFLGIDVLRRARVVKLDIEGSELPVLRELPLAEMRRAVFVVECLADTPRHAAATDAVYELFRESGFEPHYRPGGRDDWEEVFYAPAHNPAPVFSADL